MAGFHRTKKLLVCLLTALCLTTQAADVIPTRPTSPMASSAPLYEDYWDHEVHAPAHFDSITPTTASLEPSTRPTSPGRQTQGRGVSGTSSDNPESRSHDVIPAVYPTRVVSPAFHTAYTGSTGEPTQGGQLWSSPPGHGGQEESFYDSAYYSSREEELPVHLSPREQIMTTPAGHLYTSSAWSNGALNTHAQTSDREASSNADQTSSSHLQSSPPFQTPVAGGTRSTLGVTATPGMQGVTYTSTLDHRLPLQSPTHVHGQTDALPSVSAQIAPSSTILEETSSLHSVDEVTASKSRIYSWLYQSSQPTSSYRTRRPPDPELQPSSPPTPDLVQSSTQFATPRMADSTLEHRFQLSSEQLAATSVSEARPFVTLPVSPLLVPSAEPSDQQTAVLSTAATLSSKDRSLLTTAGVDGSSSLTSHGLDGLHSTHGSWPYLPSVHWTASSVSEVWSEMASAFQSSYVAAVITSTETSFSKEGGQLETMSSEVRASPVLPRVMSSSISVTIFPLSSEQYFSSAISTGPPERQPEVSFTITAPSMSEVHSPSEATSSSFPLVPELDSSQVPIVESSKLYPKVKSSDIVPAATQTETVTATEAGGAEKPKTSTTPAPSPAPSTTTRTFVALTTHEPVGRHYCHYLITFDGNCHLVMNNTMRLAEFVGALMTELTRELEVPGSRIKPHDLQCNPTKIYVSLENMHCPSTGVRIRQMIQSRRLVLPVVLEGRLATFTAYDIRQVDLPSSGIGSIDVPSVAIDNVDIIVIIVACSVCAILIVLCAIMGFRECYRRKYAQSFDLVDIPHVNLKMEDFTLTRIPRPKTIYEDNAAVQTLRKSPVPADSGYSNGGDLSSDELQVRVQPIHEGLVIGITGYPEHLNGQAALLEHRRQGSASSSSLSMSNARSPSTERLLEMEGEQAACGASNPNFQGDETPTHSANPVF